MMDQPNHTQKVLSEADQEWLNKIAQIFKLHLEHSQITIKKIAKQALMSERQLYRKLKKLTGKTPYQYLHDLRLKEAQRLLETGQCDTVKGVALSVGFSRPDYFSKIYKARYGKRPSAYIDQG